MTEQITGAQALIRALELENVDTIFGLPGGCILPAYDPLLDSHIRHILVRHEQGAGHMAEGYAHVTGRPGVALVTSGPAATNMVLFRLQDGFNGSDLLTHLSALGVQLIAMDRHWLRAVLHYDVGNLEVQRLTDGLASWAI